MEAFDHVVATAAPMLRRVDELLSGVGAPPEHAVWSQVRRVRLLPGDAVRAIAGLRATDLADASPELRADARACADIAAALPPPGTWTGDAAEAYDDARRRAAERLSGGAESLDERLEATADLADALVGWIAEARTEVAATLAEVLSSAEALSLSADEPADPAAAGQALAAAVVAERVLRTIADSYDHAADLLDSSVALATALP
jgi:methyl-accepting chemotaxis protein